MSVMGACLGFVGNGSPWLWGLRIYLGETLYGFGSFSKSMLFYSGGGVNMFIPLGLVFLIPFTLPAFIGSWAGFLGWGSCLTPRSTRTRENRARWLASC